MAITYVNTQGLYYPFPDRGFPGDVNRAVMSTLTTTSQYAAMVFRAPKTGTLDKIGFTILNVGSAQDLTVSFQDVNSTGFPDGSIDQFRGVPSASVVSNTFVVTDAITSDGTNTGSKRSVTQGDWVAFVIQLDVNGNVQIGSLATSGLNNSAYPIDNGSKQGRALMILVIYDDGTYGIVDQFATPTVLNASSTNFNNGSSPDEQGLKVSYPFPVKTSGAWVKAGISGAFDVVLYDSDGTSVLASVSNAAGQRLADNSTTYFVPFTSTATLVKNTAYRLTIKPTSATSTSIWYFDVDNAAYLDAVDSLGQAALFTARTDAGAWTDTTTRRPFLGLQVSQIGIDDTTTVSPTAFPFLGGF